MDSTKKKRHRRTKAELLQDPAYCAKHGIKYVKGKITQPILAPERKPKVKKEVKKAEEPKKRHRRTKAELLQDPVYCAKHGIPTTMEVANNGIDKAVKRKPRKRENLTKNQAIAEIEDRWMAKMYKHWENVQGCMSSMETELCELLKAKQGKLGIREFDSLDYNLGQMENRFNDFDQAIDRRRHMD